MPASNERHRKTIRHYDDPGHAHYLTFSCLRKQPVLAGRQTPIWLIDILKAVKEPVSRKALRWVSKNRPDFLARMRHEQRNGRWIHRFWQRGPGYDRNVWSPEEIHEKITYIHANPVRRGLTERPEDWPWSSYGAWEEGAEGPLRLDFESVPPLR